MLIPLNSKDLPGFRAFLKQQREQACSTASVFTGPLKVAMDDLIAKIDAWLVKLPSDEAKDNWCLDNQLDTLFNLLAQASSNATLAALELSKVTNGASEQMASALTAEIGKRVAAGELFTKDGLTAHVKTQVEAGELVTKDRLTQLCSESKLVGFGEGEAKVRTELQAEQELTKTIATRRAALQEASLPLPDADVERIILGGTDAEFEARKALFETRRQELQTEGIQLNSDPALANLWLDEAAYRGFSKTVKSLPQLKFKGNPIATVPAAPAPAKAGPPVLAAV